jgi:hypothetical protein
MCRGLGWWPFSRQIQSPLVDAQITNLSQEQSRSKHVRCYQVYVFVGSFGYFITGSCLRVRCSASHEHNNPLARLRGRGTCARPRGFGTSQRCLGDSVLNGFGLKRRTRGRESLGVDGTANMLLKHKFYVRLKSGEACIFWVGLGRWRFLSKQWRRRRCRVLQWLFDSHPKEVKIVDDLSILRRKLAMG